MGSIAADDISIPDWLNKKFITDILLKEKGKNIYVTNIDVKKALAKGENYLSVMYRVAAEYNENEDENSTKMFRVVVKTLPVGEAIQNMLSEMKGMEKELRMYTAIFPSLYRIVKEKSPNQEFRPLSARCFPTMRSDAIVLEDLQQFGYKMANRLEGLDIDHCRLVVKALARLHAGSLVLYNMDSSSMDTFEEGLFVKGEGKEQLNEYFESTLNTLSSEIDTWSGYEHYANKMRNISSSALDRVVAVVTPTKCSVNVLNHGDCWVNNMLFRYCSETGKVEDIRFVDYQIARFSSPALDLQYFLCTSPKDEIRLQEREHLLEVYHAELSDTMRQLDLDPNQFTLEQLKEEFEEKEFFGFYTSCTSLAVILASPDEAPDFSELKQDELADSEKDPMKVAYSGKRFRMIFQTMLKHYETKGII